MKFDSDYRMLIGGKLDAGSASFDVVNPANEQVIGQAPDATPEDLDRAVAAARAAFPAWSALPIEKRREYLNAMAQAILANIDPLKRLLTSEQGKPHADAEADVGGAAFWLMGASSPSGPVSTAGSNT